jgi:very-short-patch-repair endonuclease
LKEYPHILYPQVENVEQNLIDFPNSKTGFTESFFEQKLEKYFKSHILKNVTLNDGRKYPYQPDYVFFYPEKNLFIDIEIDEPYAYHSKKAIHIDDNKRNNYFLQKGWSIIRFAEVQITKYPELCCKIISEHIKNLSGENIWVEGFHELDNLRIIKAWDLIEANKMASSSYRQTYLKFLKKINEKKASINIIADGIFLHNQIKETKEILENESSIQEFNKTAKISVFLKLLVQYAGYFKCVETSDDKIYIEFTIYISKHHSFYNFSFDTDFIEIGNYIVNIYLVRTKEIICFEIIEKIKNEQLKQVMLIADDPAYPSLLEIINTNELILVKKYRDSFMPNDLRYVTISSPIENSLEIKYK